MHGVLNDQITQSSGFVAATAAADRAKHIIKEHTYSPFAVIELYFLTVWMDDPVSL